ncbi:MAG: DUF4239 domain-containing protein [Gaiellaceae bacterium]
MNILWAVLITAAVTAVAVGAMLYVRARAPEGSYFTDGDRASGVFGVLATGFSILLGFVVFLAFTSYDNSRSGAETEALMVLQQVETAQSFPAPTGPKVTRELVCYGRSVVNEEWDRMRAGTLGDGVNPWGVRLFETVSGYEPKTNHEQAAYDAWLSQTSAREEARLDRVHASSGVIPVTLWIVLFVIGGVIFAYMLFFADSREPRRTQAMLMGSVMVVITTLFLLLVSLDRPYHSGVGSLKPTAMERSLRIVDHALEAVGAGVKAPCNETGVGPAS